ncbi:hypothetical protein [Ensifer sp. B1-9]
MSSSLAGRIDRQARLGASLRTMITVVDQGDRLENAVEAYADEDEAGRS